MKERAKELKASPSWKRRPTVRATCSRSSPRCQPAIGRRPSACTRSSRPTRQLSAEAVVRDAGYAKDGKIVCFFQRGEVQDAIRDVRLQRPGDLDDGTMWPTAFALTALTTRTRH